ncbi:MAG: SDR family oxidoreductase [Burkholderiales bacterium]|nr:SDR family oxidoreductase [Burkholderiales bacterium]
MNEPSVAVVTGANRGLGFEVCRQLKAAGIDVVLTARDDAKGRAAALELGVRFHRLDVTRQDSVDALADWLALEFGHLDILVNNAGIMPDGGLMLRRMKMTMINEVLATNTTAPIRVTQTLMPLLLRSRLPRVVNISSALGQMARMGAGTPAYRISKAALNAATAVFAAEMAGTPVKINACCPGWVASDMGGAEAPKTLRQGAETAVWLATLPANGPTGGFFRDRARIDW